ncbi:MAG: hypothetical protein BJ554DRAFT_695 [Olpidium bornovanus]|uniref:Uncharacterized protein n=1 Tax=Olpidium bornovanus TaxID=278681 RepID=A0A8H7ZTI6_9FUNG|nr:MAG: hypothetical protein BJ554DRAFT_695 [Olpidium bornovanus]
MVQPIVRSPPVLPRPPPPVRALSRRFLRNRFSSPPLAGVRARRPPRVCGCFAAASPGGVPAGPPGERPAPDLLSPGTAARLARGGGGARAPERRQGGGPAKREGWISGGTLPRSAGGEQRKKKEKKKKKTESFSERAAAGARRPDKELTVSLPLPPHRPLRLCRTMTVKPSPPFDGPESRT